MRSQIQLLRANEVPTHAHHRVLSKSKQAEEDSNRRMWGDSARTTPGRKGIRHRAFGDPSTLIEQLGLERFTNVVTKSDILESAGVALVKQKLDFLTSTTPYSTRQ